MTNSEQLVAAVREKFPTLSEEEARQRLIKAGLIKRGYSIEPDPCMDMREKERTSFVTGFAVLKDGEVYCRKHTEQEALEYLQNERKSEEAEEERSQ